MNQNRQKVLIIEDDREIRENLEELLSEKYEVILSSGGREGLEKAVGERPNIVLCDVTMAGVTGHNVLTGLRSNPVTSNIPFIFLTSKVSKDDIRLGMELGADDYLTKPVDPRELVAKIEAQLERSRRIHSEIVRLMQLAGGIGKGYQPIPPSTPEVVEISPPEVEATVTPTPLPLTPAEERVFWEVIQGLTNKQISDRLFISPRTVQTHLSSILNKLQLENRAQLVRFAYEQGYQLPTEERESEQEE